MTSAHTTKEAPRGAVPELKYAAERAGHPADRGGGGEEGAETRYAQGGQSSMAEDESDQESERLGEELKAINEPRLPAGLSPALSSQYYCYRFCQVSGWSRLL